MFARRKLVLAGYSTFSSLLYGAQMFIAYSMMLLVMTYEVAMKKEILRVARFFNGREI